MKKKNLVLIIVFAVLAVAAVTVTLILSLPKKEAVPENPANVSSEKANKYLEISSLSEDMSFPYIQTDFENIFFTSSSSGEISFYKFENGSFSPINETGSVSVSVSLSSQKIPATLHYLNIDGVVCGYGIFTETPSDSVLLYDYVFFKVVNMPQGFPSSSYLLLANVYKEEFFTPDKVYSDAWTLNLSTGETSKIFKELNRNPDINGIMRTDFCSLTDNLVSFCKNGNLLFLSSRYHNSTAEPDGEDIMLRTSSGSESLKISNILGSYAHETDDGIFFLRKTDSGFNAVCLSGSSESVATSFTGDYDKEYARYGDFLYCVTDGFLYNLTDGRSKSIGIIEKEISFLRVSNDGNRVVVGGNISDKEQFLGFADLQNGKTQLFKGEKLFSRFENPNICISGDYVVHFSDGIDVSSMLKVSTVKWSDLFAE